jgi:arylsulfatase A-like enzyme
MRQTNQGMVTLSNQDGSAVELQLLDGSLGPSVIDIRKLYAADVRATDDAIGDLLEYIDERFDDDWTIVFTADHGEALGEHDYFWDHGDYVWLTELQVPLAFSLAASDPLHRVGSVDSWVSLTDVTPTLVELMGLAWPPGSTTDGRSLVPALRGDALAHRAVFGECGRSFFFDEIEGRVTNDVAGRFRTVVRGDDKLVWTPGAAQGEYRLFDIAADPTEQDDLAAGHPEKVAVLAALLHERVAGDAPAARSEPDADDLEQLEALGYVEGDEE